MPSFRKREKKYSGGDDNTDHVTKDHSDDEQASALFLAMTIIVALLVILVGIPNYSHKPLVQLSNDDMDMNELILVPNRIVQIGTQLNKINRITGDRSMALSQDLSQDEIALVPRKFVTGAFTAMSKGDFVPVLAELLDTVPWISKVDCKRRSAELGFLVYP